MTMAKLGKRTIKAREGIDRAKLYSLEDAVKLIKGRANAKFDETIEVAMNLGVDPRHSDQMVMPNPKVGSVTMDITNAVKGAKGGSVEFKVEKAGIVQAGVGKASFDEKKLIENIKAFADAVNKAKPPGAKGHYINRVAISSTMGPGVKIEPSSLFGG